MDKTLNEIYNVVQHWRLRLRYYAGMGTYLEAYSNIKYCWITLGRISYTLTKLEDLNNE